MKKIEKKIFNFGLCLCLALSNVINFGSANMPYAIFHMKYGIWFLSARRHLDWAVQV